MTKRSKETDRMGQNAESLFREVMQKNNHTVTPSAKHQDMYEHWDFLIDGKYKVEVKGRKRLRRSHSTVNDDVIFVEFCNVVGDDGWLYGQADYIAFERPDGFILVARISLVELAETLVKSTFVNQPTLYKSYRRRDRPKEWVGVIRYEDLLRIPHKLIPH